MRVQLQTHGLEAPEKDKVKGTAPSSAPDRGEKATASDRASFSFDKVRIQGLVSQALAQPEVREQKLEALRQRIGKGEYAVSDRQVADAIAADRQR